MVGDGSLVVRMLEELGFHVWFRYEKYREEFALDDVVVAVDETPVGTFVEIEGGDRGIDETAVALGRTTAPITCSTLTDGSIWSIAKPWRRRRRHGVRRRVIR